MLLKIFDEHLFKETTRVLASISFKTVNVRKYLTNKAFFFGTTTVFGQGLPIPSSIVSLAFSDLLVP